MARYFNTTGLCNPEEHYMVDPLRGKDPDIRRLIEAKQYFLIHAPRQTGKTTLLHALARRLNREGKYISVVASLENAALTSISPEAANVSFARAVYRGARSFLPQHEWPAPPEGLTPSVDAFQDYLSQWAESQSKPIVLLLDEIDALYDDV
ncbi:MAG: ATP-binding protein, partial [Saprospiraceae bacterium]|nr:ATP-binding protein [Saprospiraceae bacterium]